MQEKIKEIRQNFSHAAMEGSRSGSGKIVFEHYDLLVQIYEGSALVEPLPFGVRTINDDQENGNENDAVVPNPGSADENEDPVPQRAFAEED